MKAVAIVSGWISYTDERGERRLISNGTRIRIESRGDGYRVSWRDLGRFGMAVPITDRSRLDFNVAVHLHQRGFDTETISAILSHASAKAAESGRPYAERTAHAAVRHRLR